MGRLATSEPLAIIAANNNPVTCAVYTQDNEDGLLELDGAMEKI
jgi:hypothetical protein